MSKMRSLGTLVLIFLSVHCAPNRVEQLSDRVDAYNRSLRWSSVAAASALMAQEKRRTLVEQVGSQLSRSRVVDYSIIDLSMDEKKKSGSVLVEFSYYTIVDQNVLYRQELQSWNYDSAQKNWFLTDSKPVNSLPQ